MKDLLYRIVIDPEQRSGKAASAVAQENPIRSQPRRSLRIVPTISLQIYSKRALTVICGMGPLGWRRHGVSRLPFTLRAAPAATAPWVKSASVVASCAAFMVPPLRDRELAAMLIPSSSRSASCTV